MDKVADLVSGESIVAWLIIAALFLYFLYKEWPEFWRRVSSKAGKEHADRTVIERLATIERRLDSIDQKLQRDYDHINDIEAETRRRKKLDEESLEEREIIMRALLGVLEGRQEIGANGPTKAAHAEIKDYLNKQAHKAD